jgi:hypothetical protein
LEQLAEHAPERRVGAFLQTLLKGRKVRSLRLQLPQGHFALLLHVRSGPNDTTFVLERRAKLLVPLLRLGFAQLEVTLARFLDYLTVDVGLSLGFLPCTDFLLNGAKTGGFGLVVRTDFALGLRDLLCRHRRGTRGGSTGHL